jgi:hypothetical protein
MNVCYNSIELFVSLVTIFNFKFKRQDSSPNCHSKSRHVGSIVVLDSNLILNHLHVLGVPMGSIGNSN